MAAVVSTMLGVIPNNVNNQQRQSLHRPYKCPLCDRAFHRLEHQTRHIRTHTGDKPHPCQFFGCNKRFCRSDELKRHSRIHKYPNSRRNNKAHQVADAAPIAVAGLRDRPNQKFLSQGQMMPPPHNGMTHSTPMSGPGPPNMWPPHPFAMRIDSSNLNPMAQDRSSAMDINISANAASQIKRQEYSMARMPYQHQHHLFSHLNVHSNGRLPSLSSYAISQSMSQPQSQETRDEEPRVKRSRPGSPYFTAPSSPTFSHDSISPTPDHTPLAIPGHSPCLRLYGNDLQLPRLRLLSLSHTPLLTPMEPKADSSYSHAEPPRHTGPSISDIVTGTQRKLPVPQLPKIHKTTHHTRNGISSNESGTAVSVNRDQSR